MSAAVLGRTFAEIATQTNPLLPAALPLRTANTMSDAIALSSPNGRMSGRARKTAQDRLSLALFGEGGLQHPQLSAQPSKRDLLLQQAARLRDLATRGMRPRANVRDAIALEAEAAALA